MLNIIAKAPGDSSSPAPNSHPHGQREVNAPLRGGGSGWKAGRLPPSALMPLVGKERESNTERALLFSVTLLSPKRGNRSMTLSQLGRSAGKAASRVLHVESE